MKVRRIDFSADEWLGGTLELSPYDRGVYVTICALIYSRGEAIGIELIRRHCGVHLSALKASIARLSTAGKIDVDASSVSQRRCLEEICNTRLRMEKWTENLPQSKKNKDVSAPRAQARARRTITTTINKILDSDSDPARREGAPPSAAEVAEIDRLVAETLQSVRPNGIPYVGKRDLWLNNLAGFVGAAFDGDARMAAWQAIEDARSAGSREATPKHVRQTIDEIDKLFRTSGSYAEAAE